MVNADDSFTSSDTLLNFTLENLMGRLFYKMPLNWKL